MAAIEPQPLPPQPSLGMHDEWQERPKYLQAYQRARTAESHATKDDDAIVARVAGYLLVELFDRRSILTEEPCRQLSKELLSEDWEGGGAYDTVFNVGKHYRNHFVRLFRTTTTAHPTPSKHPSRPSFDSLQEMTKTDMTPDRKDYRTQRVLARDGYRCLLTGCFDEKSLKRNRQLAQMRDGLHAPIVTINACHIFSESTMQGVDPTGDSKDNRVVSKVQTGYAAVAMSILKSFGLKDLTDSLLEENGVDRLGNLLSLEPICHGYFDNLNLWFDHTDKDHCYKVCTASPGYKDHLNIYKHLKSDSSGDLVVTFTSSEEGLELPDPQLLSLHAACARVAHMSGAAEAFDKLEREVEDIEVLASDGSSAHLLNHLLVPLTPIPGVA